MSESIDPKVKLEIQRVENRVEKVAQEQTNHEEVCAERYKLIRGDIHQLRSLIAWGAALFVSVVLSALGWSLKTQFDNSASLNRALLLALSRQPAASSPSN